MTKELSMSVAVMGGNGFLGSAVASHFSDLGCRVFVITRENYQEFVGKSFDIVVNANGNSKKFWANQNPEGDYQASVESVANSIKDFQYKKYIYISSSDVYPDHHDPKLSFEEAEIERSRLEPYGLHKLMAEDLVKSLLSYVILRCSAMVGPGLKKGVVKDVLDKNPLFITPDSRLQFVSTLAISKVIERVIEAGISGEIFNCGGKGSVSPSEIGDVMGLKVSCRPEAKSQVYEMSVEKLDKLYKLDASLGYLKSLKPG